MSDSCEWTWQVLAPCVCNVGYSSHVSFISGRNCSHWCLNRSTVAVVRLKLAGSSTQQLVDNLLEWMYRQLSNITKKLVTLAAIEVVNQFGDKNLKNSQPYLILTKQNAKNLLQTCISKSVNIGLFLKSFIAMTVVKFNTHMLAFHFLIQSDLD